MTAEISKIILQFKSNQQHYSSETIEKAFDFLIQTLKKIASPKEQEIMAIATKNAQNYSLKPIMPQLLAAIILHPLLYHEPKTHQQIHATFDDEVNCVLRAYQLSHQHLNGVTFHLRDLFAHTLNTTLILAESKLNTQTVAASLLRHLPHFTNITIEELRAEFSEEIINLILEIEKLNNIKVAGRQNNLEHLRQVAILTVNDLRALLIKICSQIDMLKNIEEINPHLKHRYALEAMEVYAPIADLLGSWRLKWQLEDHAFKIIKPNDYLTIEKRFHTDEKKNRDKYIEKTKKILQQEAAKYKIECFVDGRFKHFYSIYQKMQQKKKHFSEVHDVFALRVVVPTIDDCYRMIGIIHGLWKPKSRRFKDYISQPKPNNYRSLHTTVIGLNNRLTEFQIRTKEMDDEAKYGVAAHWFYKNQRDDIPAWIKYILKEKNQASNKEEFFDKINSDILSEKIFVYTPKDDIITLPKGATPLDFAYQIHSNIGNHYLHAKVNDQLVPLDYKLKNEDKVTIVTEKQQSQVKPEWLNIVKTLTAKQQINHALFAQNNSPDNYFND